MSLLTTVKGCARCGATHVNLSFKAFLKPPLPHSHWALCPNTREPILLHIEGTA